jgi:hypothetical protein
MSDRYFYDRFDADGKFYVFDHEDGGSECAGPFETREEAQEAEKALNDLNPAGDRGYVIGSDKTVQE